MFIYPYYGSSFILGKNLVQKNDTFFPGIFINIESVKIFINHFRKHTNYIIYICFSKKRGSGCQQNKNKRPMGHIAHLRNNRHHKMSFTDHIQNSWTMEYITDTSKSSYLESLKFINTTCSQVLWGFFNVFYVCDSIVHVCHCETQ